MYCQNSQLISTQLINTDSGDGQELIKRPSCQKYMLSLPLNDWQSPLLFVNAATATSLMVGVNYFDRSATIILAGLNEA